jgi:hypothetical protein
MLGETGTKDLPSNVVAFEAAADGSTASAVVDISQGEPETAAPVAGVLTYGCGIPVGRAATAKELVWLEMPPGI